MDKSKIYDFIRKQKIAVISTIGQNDYPQSAVVEFGETEDLELIFDTFITSRKFENITKNPHVSFVIGWDENITVQYEGKAIRLEEEELSVYKKKFFQKNARARRWETREGITYFKVVPVWIRYSNLQTDPWEIKEISI